MSVWKRASLGVLSLLLSQGCTTERIRPDALAAALQDEPDRYVVVDVRSDREFRGRWGHIDGAVHLAYPEPLQSQADTIPVEEGQTVVLICLSGHRSKWAMDTIREATGAPVIDLKGGMLAWWRAGLPTVIE